MDYREYTPSTRLLPYVDCYWTYTAPASAGIASQPVNYCLPLGTVELIIHLEEQPSYLFNLHGEGWHRSHNAFFAGIFDYTALWKASPGSTLFGIRMKPEAVAMFFGVQGSVLFNQVADAEALLSIAQRQWLRQLYGIGSIASLIEKVNVFLLEKVANVKEERDYVAEGLRLIRKDPASLSVEALSEKLYISRRQLERHFKSTTGLSPKAYQQIIRFRRLYQHITKAGNGPVKWAGLSYPLGYADQAHLVRECKKFSNFTPLRLANREHGIFQSLEVTAAC